MFLYVNKINKPLALTKRDRVLFKYVYMTNPSGFIHNDKSNNVDN